MLLNDATNTWNATQDVAAAESSSGLLAQIDPNAACFKDVKVLADKIAARIKQLDQREWSFKLKEQQDNVDVAKARISAARDIGVAYGKNQPQTKVVVYKVRGWW
jgi:hypothetical protein